MGPQRALSVTLSLHPGALCRESGAGRQRARTGGASRPTTHQDARVTRDVSISSAIFPTLFLPSFQGENKPSPPSPPTVYEVAPEKSLSSHARCALFTWVQPREDVHSGVSDSTPANTHTPVCASLQPPDPACPSLVPLRPSVS